MNDRYRRLSTGLKLLALYILTVFLYACAEDVNYTPPANSSETAITHYSFGKIVIDGKTYEADVAVFPDQTVQKWHIQTNHMIQLIDIKALIDNATQTLIIGTGASEICTVKDDIVDYAASKGIKLIIRDTYEAVRQFNKLPKEGLSAGFHLNC
jgi:hypothetical protein